MSFNFFKNIILAGLFILLFLPFLKVGIFSFQPDYSAFYVKAQTPTPTPTPECERSSECPQLPNTCDGDNLIAHQGVCILGKCEDWTSTVPCSDYGTGQFGCGTREYPDGLHCEIQKNIGTCEPATPTSTASCTDKNDTFTDCGLCYIYVGTYCYQGEPSAATGTNFCTYSPPSATGGYICEHHSYIGAVDYCANHSEVLSMTCEADGSIVTISSVYSCVEGPPDADGKPTASCVMTGTHTSSIQCGPASTTTTSYCSGGLQCTMTTENPGQCFYYPEGSTTVGGCKAPTISTVCDGPCGSGSCTPGSVQACTNGGTQTCDSNGLWGPCTGDTHNICNTQQQCINVAGAGTNQCQTNSDCISYTHNECNTQQQCVVVSGTGSNQCQSNWDCANNTHTECNGQQQCVVIFSAGSNQCQSNNDCISTTHTECSGNTCVTVSGTDISRCQNNQDCINTYNECNADQQCVTLNGIGINRCINDTSCVPTEIVHNECNTQGQCIIVNSSGYDQCQTNNDCATSYPTQPKCGCSPYGAPICDTNQTGANCTDASTCPSCPTQPKCGCSPYGAPICDTNQTGANCTDASTCPSCPSNLPPYAENLISGLDSPCTGIQGAGISHFVWKYGDVEGDTEKKFILQIDDSEDFSSPEVFRTYDNLSYPAGALNEQTVLVKAIPTIPFGDYLNYNVFYYWRVMVQENGTNLYSDWTYYDRANGTTNPDLKTTFMMTGHPAPSPIFTFSPPNPIPGQAVDFTDLSVCYDNNGPYLCKNITPSTCVGGSNNCYTWNFGDGSSLDHTIPDPAIVTHSYVATGTYSSYLKVCDELYCCSVPKNIPVRTAGAKETPNWKEISPF